jgi:hypothetical protein
VASRRRDGIYKGALAKPIMLQVLPSSLRAHVPEQIYRNVLSRYERENAAMVQQQYEKKLAMLFDHYGIADKKNWAALARALAAQHVPGFRIQSSKSGRKRIWDSDKLQELERTVQSIRQQHAFNNRQALTFMVNNSEQAATWGVPTVHKGSKQQWIETLEARLQEAKKHRKIHDHAERLLNALHASMKFRK